MNFEEIIPNERLRRARHEKGWTQAELAEKVGTTFETVSRWERGIKAPSAFFRKKLCDVFGKTAEELGLLTDPSAIPTPGLSPCVFFSSAYADAEDKFVIFLKEELQSSGFTVWSSRTIRRQETRNKRSILQEAIRAAQIVLLIVSPHTQASYHVKDTLRLARHFRRPVFIVWICGEYLQECLPEGHIEPYATIDARTGDEHFLREEIIAALEKIWLSPINPETPRLSEPVWKVPVMPMTFIGREAELAKLRELLLSSQIRLVTLLGPGGVGKTHLGLHVAMEMREHFADGVCFVSLASIINPSLVIPAIAKALGVREVGDRWIFEQVKVALGNRELLLLIDNFEHLLEAASQLHELLAECPNLRILVTSRARLHVHDEYEFSVTPLALPDLTQPLETDTLSRNASVALFVHRAQIARNDFRITPMNMRAIAEICVRLDGLPLAIVLAAARIRSLASQALLERLVAHLLDVVVSTDQDIDDRQRTLRNTIEWSYELLAGEQQKLFSRVSVFAGGWTVETVEELYNALGDSALDVWGGVESLLDMNLLQPAEHEGEGRLRLLETIREYGLECLYASGETEATRREHAKFYLRLVQKAEPQLKGVHQTMWLTRLEQEQENLRAALSWFIEHREAESALHFCAALWWFWHLRGYWSEGRRWFEASLDLEQIGEPTAIRATVLCGAGDLAYYQDDYNTARDVLEESVMLCRKLGAEKELAIALGMQGVLMHVQGDLLMAGPLLEESEKLSRMLGSDWELAYLLRKLAYLATQDGDLKRAVACAQESLSLAQKLGDKSLMSTTLSTLGDIVAHQGDLRQAIAYNKESLTFAREVGDKSLIALALQNLGYYSALWGDLTMAAYAQEGLELQRELGDRLFIVLALHCVGNVMARQGNLEQATALYREGISLAQEIGNEKYLGWLLSGLAMVALAESQPLQAARLFGATEARLDINVDMNAIESAEYKRAVEVVRRQLGRKAFAEAHKEGLTMSPEQFLTAPRLPTGVNSLPTSKYPDGLTEREVQVLCHLAKGLTDEQIARQLVIAPRTVNTHLTSIYRKIQVSSVGGERQVAPRIAATRYVTEHDLC